MCGRKGGRPRTVTAVSTSTGDRLTTSRIAIAVAVGVLLAAGIIYVVWSANQPSDFDCAAQQADYQLGNIELYEIDDACR